MHMYHKYTVFILFFTYSLIRLFLIMFKSLDVCCFDNLADISPLIQK